MRRALKEWAELPTTEAALMHDATHLSATLAVLAEEHLQVSAMEDQDNISLEMSAGGSLDVMDTFKALLAKHMRPIISLAIAVTIGTALTPTPSKIFWPPANCEHLSSEMQRLRGMRARVTLTIFPGIQTGSGGVWSSKTRAKVYT